MQTLLSQRNACSLSKRAFCNPCKPPSRVVMQLRPVIVDASTKIYVGNLSWNTTKDDLFQHFAQFGDVQDAYVATDRETGRSRGFGFVTLESDAASEAISQSDGTEYMGRNIRVNEAQPRPERTGSYERSERPERRSYSDASRGYSGSRGGGRAEYSGRRDSRGSGFDRRSENDDA